MKQEIYLILDNIRSRENVGSIFRTADGVGVSKIFLCGITPTPQNSKQIPNSKSQIQNSDKISKTALGAEKWVPWEYHAKVGRLLRKLKVESEKLKVVALEQTKDSENIFKFRPNFPIALILGNEVRGLSPKILKHCDKKIAIPMYGRKESLNVAVAAGIAVYQLLKTK